MTSLGQNTVTHLMAHVTVIQMLLGQSVIAAKQIILDSSLATAVCLVIARWPLTAHNVMIILASADVKMVLLDVNATGAYLVIGIIRQMGAYVS